MRPATISTAAMALVLGLTAVGLAASSARPAQAQAADPLRELAERLLNTPYATPAGQTPTVQLVPGQLPGDLPLALLQPPGTGLVGSMVRSAGGRTLSEEIVLDVPGASAGVSGAYEKDLAAQGWKPPTNGPGQPHGFVSTPPTIYHTYCHSSSGPWLNLSVSGRTNAPNDVRLTINFNPGPCAPRPALAPSARPASAGGFDMIPPLSPPEGVTIQTNGGSGGGGRWTSEATATTGQTPGLLEGHFSQELLAAGWTRLAGRDDGPLSWSSWKVPRNGDWQGLLYVVQAPGQNRRSLSVRVDSASAGAAGAIGSAYATGTAHAVAVSGPPPATAPVPPRAIPPANAAPVSSNP